MRGHLVEEAVAFKGLRTAHGERLTKENKQGTLNRLTRAILAHTGTYEVRFG